MGIMCFIDTPPKLSNPKDGKNFRLVSRAWFAKWCHNTFRDQSTEERHYAQEMFMKGIGIMIAKGNNTMNEKADTYVLKCFLLYCYQFRFIFLVSPVLHTTYIF